MRIDDAFRDGFRWPPQSVWGRLYRYIAVLGACAFLFIAVGTIFVAFELENDEGVRRFAQGGNIPVLPFLALTTLLWFAALIGAQLQRRSDSSQDETQPPESTPLSQHLAIALGPPLFAYGAFSIMIPAFCTLLFGADVSFRAQITETGIEAARCNFAVLADAPPAEEFELCVSLKLLMELAPGDAIDISARVWRGYTIRGAILKAATDVLPAEQPAEIHGRILTSHFARTPRH